MARHVAELLPRPFEALELTDIHAMVESIGDERETLFFERKAHVTGASLAKACSAFANTMGGLLIVGIADDELEIAGVDQLAQEAQLWVKDTLRSHVLPMPPFRARWLPLEGDNGRGVLLVLVEESTATPHLLTRSGAIYVRNPGSSDPVPLSDQGRLLELVRRGEFAEAGAIAAVAAELEAPRLLAQARIDQAREVLAFAATGVTADFEARLFDRATVQLLEREAWGEPNDPRNDGRWAAWGADYAGVTRMMRPHDPFQGDHHLGVAVTRGGGITFHRSTVSRIQQEREYEDALDAHDLRAWIAQSAVAARTILSDLGAHGRLRLGYRLNAGDRVLMFMNQHRELPAPIIIGRWTNFESTDDAGHVFDEIERTLGFGPGDVHWR